MFKNDDIKKAVRENYSRIAVTESSCCGGSSCLEAGTSEDLGKSIGYSDEELQSVPEGSNLGLGCGNPTALASIQKGETVLDLGSGAGFDCFLASERTGSKGKVIGVDMTPEMVEKARNNAQKGDYDNVEFRLGEIENLPVENSRIDAIISNCVINLSTDKQRVFNEAFRVLKPGGRVMVSDIVLLKDLPEEISNSIAEYVGCVAGAEHIDDYIEKIRTAGFEEVRIIEQKTSVPEGLYRDLAADENLAKLNIPADRLKDYADRTAASITVHAKKPNRFVL